MSDDTPTNDDAKQPIPPSTLFLEMMREAAAKRYPPAPEDEPAPAPERDAPPPSDIADIADSDAPPASDVTPAPPPTPNDDPLLFAAAEFDITDDLDIIEPPIMDEAPVPPPTASTADDDTNDTDDTDDTEEDITTASHYDLPDEISAHSVADEPDFLAVEAPPSPAPDDKPRQRQMPIYEAPVYSEEERAAKLEEQRVRRVRRRQERRQRRRAGMVGGFMRTVFVAIFAAGLASTIFTWFTQPDFITQDVASGLQVAQSTSTPLAAAAPTALPTPNWLRRIGIVAGHAGPENDPGAVCPDGLTELEINIAVAQQVVQRLRQQGYNVDLLDEFDPRLDNYQAAALVSIHSNSCEDYGERVSGFLVSKAAARPEGGVDTMLAECIADYYGAETELERRLTLTLDMTDYHTFREIHPLTPAAILELGFMKDDRQLLTDEQDRLAKGIVEGVECFLAVETSPMRRSPVQSSAAESTTDPAATPTPPPTDG